MDSRFNHRRPWRAPFLAILGLAIVGGWLRASLAHEPDVHFSLTPALDDEAFQPMDQHPLAEIAPLAQPGDSAINQASYAVQQASAVSPRRMGTVRVGYDEGFVIANQRQRDLGVGDVPYLLRINGWGQLRHTNFNSQGMNPDINQFQLPRARLVFSGNALSPDFAYFVQLDGRSTSGDDVRLLDYFLTYDLGHHSLGFDKRVLEFKAGKYKIPFSMARYLSGREFEFTDRSVASMFFDVNRSLAWGLYGEKNDVSMPWNWEVALFNGLVTGGAETGSSGALDNNFAYSARVFVYPSGEWGLGELADFQWHETLAVRAGAALASSQIERDGMTEFDSVRVVDSGELLSALLPAAVDKYDVYLFAVDASCKLRGWSATLEYYFRNIDGFDGAPVPALFDHGFWLQLGKFVVPRKLQLLARWSRVVGNSGTLGAADQSTEEIAGGVVWYFHDQHAKVTFDFTNLDGAPIDSPTLDISPGDVGWLFRTQVQIAF